MVLPTLLAQVAGSAVSVVTAAGCGRNDTSTTGFAAALAVGRQPGVSHVVLAVGMDGHLEGEGNDLLPSRFPVPAENAGLRLPGVQQQLIQQVGALGKPTVLVVVSGGSYSVPPTAGIGATLHALYPGIEAGNGIADLLFGVASPASRLPVTILESLSQLPDCERLIMPRHS